METALSSGADKEEPACGDASSIEIAAHTLDLRGFLQALLQGSFHHRLACATAPARHHPTKWARAKAASAADLKFLSRPRRARQEFQIEKRHLNHVVASAPVASEIRVRACG
jgi:hypothetical protein